MDRKLILPSLRQTSVTGQASPRIIKRNQKIRFSKNVDFRLKNVEAKRRTPSPLNRNSPVITANSIFQTPLSYKMKNSEFSNDRSKSKQKDIVYLYARSRKKKEFPQKIFGTITKVESKFSIRPKISITPTARSRNSDFSCQIDF